MHDLIIIGGSAAGTAATIYASRRGLKVLVLAKDLGGEVATSGEIENWPGIIHTTGIELSEQFQKHLRSFNPDIVEGKKAVKIEKRGEGDFVVTTDDDATYEGKAVLIAAGVRPRTLDVPGEKDYRGKGVTYCTVCDGPIFKGKDVAVIGGGNSALEAALMMADLSPKVYVINKNAQFKGDSTLIENLQKKSNVEVVYEALTMEVLGNGKLVSGLKYKDKDGAEHELTVEAIFVHIGMLPNSMMVPDAVRKDEYGQIIVDMGAATSVPGIFAAGDVTDVPQNQIIVAAGQGALGALSAVQYINRLAA